MKLEPCDRAQLAHTPPIPLYVACPEAARFKQQRDSMCDGGWTHCLLSVQDAHVYQGEVNAGTWRRPLLVNLLVKHVTVHCL